MTCLFCNGSKDAVAPEDLVLSMTVNGQPMPKERPRFAPGGWAYSGQRSRHYERGLRAAFQAATGGGGVVKKADGRSAFGMRCRFFRGDRVRCDVDNLLKSVADAANGVVWADDSQVTEVYGKVYRAQEEPRVEVTIYRVRVE